MRRFASIEILVGILCGLSFGQADTGQQGENNSSLVGTSWEIVYPLHPERGVFVRAFSVWDARDYTDRYDYRCMTWWGQGRWFEISLYRKSGDDKLAFISGMADRDRTEGVERTGKRISTWNGHKVDGDQYAYFIDPTQEEIIIIKMLGYRIDDACLGYSRDRAVREPKDETEIKGRVFEILSPEKLRGVVLLTGYESPRNGYPYRMSALDQRYFQRHHINKQVQDVIYSFSENVLDLHETDCQTIDDATLEMQQWLYDENIQRRNTAAHRLANFNTTLSRQTLLEAYWTIPDRGTKRWIVYVLSKFPGADAEGVFLDVLEGDDSWAQWHAIQALVKIQSAAAIASMQRLEQKARNWFLYYACVQALRKLEGWELPKDLQDALYTFRISRNFETEPGTHKTANGLILHHLEIVASDIMDIYLETDLPESKTAPFSNSMQLLNQLGQGASDLIRRCLGDEDPFIRVKGMLLAKSMHREREFIDFRKSVKEDATFAWYYSHYGQYWKE